MENGVIMPIPNDDGENNDHQEIIPYEQNVDFVIRRAEKQLEIMKKIMVVAVKRTNHRDWIDQGGNPYLTAPGAEKLMSLFKISVTKPRKEKEIYSDDKGQYYIYTYTGVFSWEGGTIEAVGMCSSRDRFFAWNSKTGEYKPLSEIDEPNIAKAAYSNMLVNGITRLLGIRNLTWDELKEFGIDRNKIAKVTYNGGKKDDSYSNPPDPKEELMRAEITAWLKEMAGGDVEQVKNYLEDITSFESKEGNIVSGVRSTKLLKGKRLQITHHKVKESYERWKATQSSGGEL